MGIGKRRPDGKKIAELRKQQGLPQKTLAGKANNMSERLLRDIERNNKSVSSTFITALATALGVTPDEITLASDKTSKASASLLRLRVVRSATDLYSLASPAERYRWGLKVDPSVATAGDMRQVMTILDRLVQGAKWANDEFDELPFGEIPRLARLQELLEKLHANGVGILAGSYFQRLVIDKKDEAVASHIVPPKAGYVFPSTAKLPMIKFESHIIVRFVPREVEEEVITLDRPAPLDDEEIPF